MGIIRTAVEIACTKTIIEAGLLNPYLTLSSAYKQYGRRSVDKWIKEGSITAHKTGDKNSKVQLDRIELSMLVKSTELMVYFKQAA
ncbi:hypothetical protein [uncultured Mucilaginibacter sp.]|uniref:hypothetical protein n=1 Tax=uncultured Mucilaginibacter sp. TaxID=797541 RepID=UPI0025E9F330|nr:hypothetical protein [uncultured Mucilaginibacter sp.]